MIIVLCFSVYVFAESYGLLLSARAIQGVGSCVNRISSKQLAQNTIYQRIKSYYQIVNNRTSI